VPAARRRGVQRTATGAGEEQKQAEGRGVMFLEMLAAKNSEAVPGRERWRERGQKRQQTEIQIIFFLFHVYSVVLLLLLVSSAWALQDVRLESCCKQCIIQTKQVGSR